MAKLKFKISVLACLITSSLSVFADEIENNDVIVITASAVEQSIKSAPASISVITAEDLEKNVGKTATDLADILEQVAGVSKSINTDVGSGIQIRGMPAQYTLLLVDGRRVGSSNGTKSTQQNYFNDINWIPVESIERIEVVRGPMSSLYGSDAMGGVVNIITKKNKDVWSGSLTVGTRQPQDSDTGDTTTYTTSFGGPLGNGFNLRLNGSWNKRNSDTSDTNSLRWGSGQEGRKTYNYGGELSWDINDNNQITAGIMQGSEVSIQGHSSNGSMISLRGPDRIERDNYFIDYKGFYDFANIKLSAYRNEYKNIISAYPGIKATDNIVEGSLNIPFELWVSHEFTLGGQWLKEELNNSSSINNPKNPSNPFYSDKNTSNSASSKAIFAEDQLFLLDDLTLTLGLRFDNTDYGNQTTPRAYLVYNASDSLTLKGGYSEGFKAPSLRQSAPGFIETSKGAGCNGYADYVSGGCATAGNPDLKPETSKNWEISANYDYNGWNAGITFFDTHFENKLATSPIGYISGDTSGRYWLERVNLDRARTQGVEANLTIPLINQAIGPWLQSLKLRNNFTRMIKAEDSLGVMLVTTPKFTSYSSLDWQVNDELGFAFTGKFYGKMLGLGNSADESSRGPIATARIRNSYAIFDLSGHFKATNNLKFNFGVDNLFDRNPVTEPTSSSSTGSNYYVPGRTFYASLTASF